MTTLAINGIGLLTLENKNLAAGGMSMAARASNVSPETGALGSSTRAPRAKKPPTNQRTVDTEMFLRCIGGNYTPLEQREWYN